MQLFQRPHHAGGAEVEHPERLARAGHVGEVVRVERPPAVREVRGRDARDARDRLAGARLAPGRGVQRLVSLRVVEHGEAGDPITPPS